MKSFQANEAFFQIVMIEKKLKQNFPWEVVKKI